MLPVFTSPRGSRKVKVESLWTLYWRSASASDALLGIWKPLLGGAPFSAKAVEGGGAFRRTRSAQDFGAGFGGGAAGTAASSAGCSPFAVSDFCSPDVDTGAACEVGDAIGLSEVAGGDGLGLAIPGMFGTAIAVRVSRRAC